MGISNDIREDTYENGDSTSIPNGGHSSEVASTRSSSLREQRDSKRRSDMSVEDMYKGEYGVDDDEEDEDSDWEPVLPQIDENGGSNPAIKEILNSEATNARSSHRREERNAKSRDMTVEALFNGEYDVEDDDEEEDNDWEPVLPQIDENGSLTPVSKDDLSSVAVTARSSHVHEQRNGKRRGDMTVDDIYNEYGLEDEDEEEDSDWESLPQIDENGFLQFSRWFCKNCTMANLETEVRCDVCNEHKESGILKHGFLASAFTGLETFPDNVVDAADKLKDSSFQSNAPENNTAVGFDERMLLHEEVDMKSRPHPERPDRLRAIAASLATAGIFPGRCSSIPAREITREELQMIHSIENIDAVQHTAHFLSSYFTPDTYANQYSACAARLAAGLCYDLAVAICSGKAKNGFALVRPPGHHAGVKQAMGFCLHNNAAIAASAAQFAGAKKILIVDWDVHHGNGTQEIFEKNSSVLYISLHRHEGGNFYPGTGAADEVGSMGAEGYCVNVPWSKGGVGDNDYVFAFNQVVLPIASEFNPDFTIISAGFDAARGDPLGCCDVTPTGYAQMTQMCSALSGGKLMVILEGGYNLRSISSSATAVIKVLLGESSDNVEQVPPTNAGLQTVLEVMRIQMKYWPLLEPKYLKLQSEWGNYALQDKRKSKKQKRLPSAPMGWNSEHKSAPFWWKLGRKRWLYQAICKKFC